MIWHTTTEFIIKEKLCTKGFREWEKQVKKMMVKQATMGMRAHSVSQPNLLLDPFFEEKNFHDRQLQAFIVWRLSSGLVLTYFQQKISIIVVPTTPLKSSKTCCRVVTRRLRNTGLEQRLSTFAIWRPTTDFADPKVAGYSPVEKH